MKKQIILAVANQIQNMMYNDITCENGVESFECWCNDGEVFENEGMDAADVKECMQLVKAVAPLVDDLVLNHLNIDNPDTVSLKKESDENPAKVWVMTQESNVNGEIFFNVLVCNSEETAKAEMKKEIEWIKNESHHFRDFDKRGDIFETERSEHRFFINDDIGDYYEEIMVTEKEIVS